MSIYFMVNKITMTKNHEFIHRRRNNFFCSREILLYFSYNFFFCIFFRFQHKYRNVSSEKEDFKYQRICQPFFSIA